MDRPSQTTTLDISEILREVFEYVDAPYDLASCASVNQKWHEEAIPVLWRGSRPDEAPDNDRSPSRWHTPELRHLQELSSDLERFEHYIRHVRYLSLNLLENTTIDRQKPIWGRSFSLWRSVKPRSITVDVGPRVVCEDMVRELLSPNLRFLALSGSPVSRQFVEQLSKTAPKLQCVQIDNRDILKYSPSLRSFILSLHQLKYLDLYKCSSIKISLAAMEILRLPSLEHLAIDDPIISSEWALARVPPEERFPRLRSIHLGTAGEGIIDTLFEPLARVESVHLKLIKIFPEDNLRYCFEPLSECENLKEFTSVVKHDISRNTDVIVESFICLAEGKTKLEKLSIIPYDLRTRHGHTESLFGRLNGSFPYLRFLTLPFTQDVFIGAKDLTRLAECCPQLVYLHLGEAKTELVDEYESYSDAIFPHLEELIVGSLGKSASPGHEARAGDFDSWTQRAKDILDVQTPMLKHIRLTLSPQVHDTRERSLNEHLTARKLPFTAPKSWILVDITRKCLDSK